VQKKDFIVNLPARLLKDETLSGDARMLRALIASFADAKTGRSYVKPETLQENLRWGRRKREKAQRELERTGWLHLGWSRAPGGRFRRRIYEVRDPATTVAHFERSGETEQLISYYSQSKVKSSIPTILTEPKKKAETPFERSDLT
jgi:alkylation response protein AidB-like acyl-CoA dehydrogenase